MSAKLEQKMYDCVRIVFLEKYMYVQRFSVSCPLLIFFGGDNTFLIHFWTAARLSSVFVQKRGNCSKL